LARLTPERRDTLLEAMRDLLRADLEPDQRVTRIVTHPKKRRTP
jgi:hypothetical protein